MLACVNPGARVEHHKIRSCVCNGFRAEIVGIVGVILTNKQKSSRYRVPLNEKAYNPG